MQTLTFNKRSWHYTIAKFGGFDRWEDQDLCTYTNKFIRGLFQSALIGIAIAIVGFGLWNFIFGIIFSIMASAFVMNDVGCIFGVVIFILSVSVLIGIACRHYEEKQQYRLVKPDGFVKNAYKGWKEKYCIKVVVQE
jgi:hypothetical protein